MMPINLFVVRHGESLGNLAKKMSEKGDHSLLTRLHGTHTAHWPLTKKGITQAQASGVFVNELRETQKLRFDRMYVSSYARAMQTALHLGIPEAEWIVDPRITERDWGDLDSLTEDEREEKFGQALKMRTVEPFFWAPPNGESFKDLIIRIRDFIDSLHRVKARNVLVVCHGEVMKAFRIIFLQLTPREYALMEFSKDPLERIHNCQIDHYSRCHPSLPETASRLEWLQVYRPAEGLGVVIPWRPLPRRRFTNDDLARMAQDLSGQFAGLDL